MLDPRQYHTTSPVDSAEPFQAYLQQPFPRTPQAFLEMEPHLYRTAAQLADHLVLMKIAAAPDDPE